MPRILFLRTLRSHIFLDEAKVNWRKTALLENSKCQVKNKYPPDAPPSQKVIFLTQGKIKTASFKYSKCQVKNTSPLWRKIKKLGILHQQKKILCISKKKKKKKKILCLSRVKKKKRIYTCLNCEFY